jgi:hypothetical protein
MIAQMAWRIKSLRHKRFTQACLKVIVYSGTCSNRALARFRREAEVLGL